MSEPLVAVVLAAGQGTRMKSARPKVLHEVAGRPLVSYPIDAALELGAERIVVVVGHGREEVEATLAKRSDARIETVVQAEQRGTGHATQIALTALPSFEGTVLILYGDCPLVPIEALRALLDAKHRHGSPLALLVGELDDPTGYGRVLRNEAGAVIGIREQRDASEAERAICEVNPGMYAVDASFLRTAIDGLSTDNAQGELYLTDVVAAAANDAAANDAGAHDAGAADAPWPMADLLGINDRWELALAETRMQARLLERHAKNGVTLRDPARTWIGTDVVIETDAVIEPGVVLRGRTKIGAGAHIDVGSVLDDVEVAAGARLLPYTVATDSRIGEQAQTGPFSHLRPGTVLGADVRIGNFVELKKTSMGRGSKANHLAYLGDGIVGEGVNVGAGTIFCNYDGFKKHTTVLEDGCFIGSDSQIVAPVTIGKGAYVATGTTVTRDVPADALAVGRARQVNKEGYATRLKARLKS